VAVTIIIVSYRSSADVGRCLAALEASTWTDFDVVICENGGPEAFKQLEALPSALKGGQAVRKVLAPGNLGFAGGINFGLHAAPGADAYWILNPDTLPEPTTLEAMVRRLRQGDCAAVGHDLVNADGRLASVGGQWKPWSARGVSIDRGKQRSKQDRLSVEARMNYIIGASMLVSRQFLDQIGEMREDYFLYCEEVEWCLRAARAGLKLGYAEDALVLHVQGTSTGGGGSLKTQSKIAVYFCERNRILLTRDLYPSRLPATLLLSLTHLLVRYGKARAWRQLGFAISGWLAGLRDERGVPAWFGKA